MREEIKVCAIVTSFFLFVFLLVSPRSLIVAVSMYESVFPEPECVAEGGEWNSEKDICE